MWDWRAFRGSPEAIRYLRRDLPSLDVVIRHARGHTACLQAGGHLGAFPKRLAKYFRTVYTCEPAPDNFATLMQNAPERNIIKLQVALGDRHRLVALARTRRAGTPGPIHEGLTYIDDATAGVVPMLRIDDLNLPVCDLILLDVEGSETEALQGATATLARCRPLLCVENNKNQGVVGRTEDQLRQLIASFGYRQIGRVMSDDLCAPVEWPLEATA